MKLDWPPANLRKSEECANVRHTQCEMRDDSCECVCHAALKNPYGIEGLACVAIPCPDDSELR